MTQSSEDARSMERYAEFLKNRHTAPALSLAPYPRPFEGGTFNVLAMPFHTVAQEALREVANSINDFGRYMRALHAWRPIQEKAALEDQHDLLLEHVRPLTTLCLSAPQGLRGRLIHAATATSYHANIFLQWPQGRPNWNGGHTSMKSAAEMNTAWASWPNLALCLNQMGTKPFNDATSDFRNQHEHGHPRSIALGHISTVRRVEHHGRVGWSFGEQAPMQLADLLPLFEKEHAHVLAAFHAYVALVEEQNAAMPP